MPTVAEHIYKTLSEWPERPVGSEDEMMAREALMTELLDEPNLEIAEEGLRAPKSKAFIEMAMLVCLVVILLIAPIMPYIAVFVSIFMASCIFMHIDGRQTPFQWFVPTVISSNLVASKGNGKRLYLLVANLDTQHSAKWRDYTEYAHSRISFYASMGIVALSCFMPFLYVFGFGVSPWLVWLLICILFILFIGRHYLGFGERENNLSGVAAAVMAARSLWRALPSNTEVRLVITTAGSVSGFGFQHYLNHHKEAFQERDIYVLNYDTPHGANIAYIEHAGILTPVIFEGIMQHVAKGLVKLNPAYKTVKAADAHTDILESLMSVRAGYKTLTVSSNITKNNHPNMEKISIASKFGEAVLRMLPEIKS